MVRRALKTSRSLPDPLENIALVVSKDYPVSPGSRMFVDVPGTTLCRGLSNVPMRQGHDDGKRMEHNLWVRESTAKDVMHGCVKAAEAVEEDEEEEEEEEAKQEENGAEEEEEATQVDEDVMPLVPWAKSEAVSREMLNIHKTTHQVIFASGEGEDALAGVRHKIPTLVFVRNEKHASVMSQHLVSTMMLEHCDSVSDGFFFSRCLVRVRSVAGEEPGTAENTPGKAEKSQSAGEEPGKAENTPGKAEPPLKKHKSCPTTEKDSEDSSDDSSDDSDGDEDSDKEK